MADLIPEIIDDFVRRKWKSDPYARFEELVFRNPDRIGEFLHAALQQWSDGGTFFADVISYAHLDVLRDLVPVALDLFETKRSEQGAEELIARCSQQAPTLLHPHLDRIFRLGPNRSTYYAEWPWRESGDLSLGQLSGILANGSDEEREFAITALAETRTTAAFQLVIRGGGLSKMTPGDSFLQVGFRANAGRFERLYEPQPYHLVFPAGYFPIEKNDPPHMRRHHPTWKRNVTSGLECRFGGSGSGICRGCGKVRHHVLTFETGPISTIVSSRTRLVLETCLSCLGWEAPALSYRHDLAGVPMETEVTRGSREPEFPCAGLKETTVVLTAAAKRWFWQDWALSNDRENLHRLGGFPCWVQNPDYALCPDCGEVMKFLMQLDSNLPTTVDGDWLWGSGGIGYIRWCDACAISTFNWQCT